MLSILTGKMIEDPFRGQIGTQFVLLRLPFATGGEPETRWPRIMLLLVAARRWPEMRKSRIAGVVVVDDDDDEE